MKKEYWPKRHGPEAVGMKYNRCSSLFFSSFTYLRRLPRVRRRGRHSLQLVFPRPSFSASSSAGGRAVARMPKLRKTDAAALFPKAPMEGARTFMRESRKSHPSPLEL